MYRSAAIRTLFLAALLGGAGCSNPFKETYRSSLERWPSGEVSRILPAQGKPKLVTSADMRRDVQRMMEGGYLLLGRSRFRSSQVDAAAARTVAEEIGASVVLVEQQYAETITEAVPMSEWIPERQVTIVERGVVRAGPDIGQVYETEVTKTIQGEFRTTHIPQTTDYYEYAATYWAKSKPPIFGVLVRALDDSTRLRIQSNRGVMIRAVITDSPAFHADLLRGDIILRFAGEQIVDPDQFFDTVIRNSGRLVDVEIDRNGERKTIPAQLKAE